MERVVCVHTLHELLCACIYMFAIPLLCYVWLSPSRDIYKVSWLTPRSRYSLLAHTTFLCFILPDYMTQSCRLHTNGLVSQPRPQQRGDAYL